MSAGVPVVWLRAGASIVLGAFGQLCFRRFGMAQEQDLLGALSNLQAPAALPFLVAGVLAYGIAVLLWVQVLQRMTLARAYPLLSLGYPLVYLGATLWLGEAFTAARTVGTLAVCVGVALAVSEPRSQPS